MDGRREQVVGQGSIDGENGKPEDRAAIVAADRCGLLMHRSSDPTQESLSAMISPLPDPELAHLAEPDVGFGGRAPGGAPGEDR